MADTEPRQQERAHAVETARSGPGHPRQVVVPAGGQTPCTSHRGRDRHHDHDLHHPGAFHERGGPGQRQGVGDPAGQLGPEPPHTPGNRGHGRDHQVEVEPRPGPEARAHDDQRRATNPRSPGDRQAANCVGPAGPAGAPRHPGGARGSSSCASMGTGSQHRRPACQPHFTGARRSRSVATAAERSTFRWRSVADHRLSGLSFRDLGQVSGCGRGQPRRSRTT